MHSGSSISPKHPAIPISIGIASLVLEGRSSALDDSSIHAPSTSCAATSSVLANGHGTGDGGAGGGSSSGSGGAGGEDDEDGGFCRQKRSSEGTGAGASSLQQCSLLAINESHGKSLAMSCCHTPDEAQRINLKLQQIRSSCPSTSKDEVQQLVTVSGEPSRLPGGRRHERELYQTYSNAAGQRDSLERGTASSASSAASWVSHDHAAISSAAAGVVIYSGFEKMNVLGTVSPIKNHPMGNSFINFSSPTPTAGAAGATSSASVNAIQSRKPVAGGGSSSSKLQASSRPREGPHCEQFLKKIGLNKPEAADGPEHHCSYRNKYCLRWQVYFKQLSSILTNGEAVCIEVYLGPENHTILLEQWILKLVMTKSPATMTIQSLCAAIRSQLYFSQISAWSDLIKKSLESDLFSNPRIKKLIPAAKCKAGGGSPFSLAQARLDILFRIRTYDNTACFNEKPNVHNFPDASVADNFVIQVCLKSLPRLDRIPGIDAALDAAKMSATLQKQQQVDRIPLPCHEKGKHRCAFRVELEEEEDDDDLSMVEGGMEGESGDGDVGGEDSMLLTSAAISHREKQLLKYRKRMLKREKKKKAGGAVGEGNSSASPTSSSSNTSSGATSVSDRNGSSADGSSYLSAKSCYIGSQIGPVGNNMGSKSNHPSTEPTANNACSNGNCRNALTSSINSIQPPLYSSTDRHQVMMVCDDRFHAIATNSKSTQTATAALSVDLLVPPLVSVATQTEPTVSTAMVCSDCKTRSSRTASGNETRSLPAMSKPAQREMEVSQNMNHASSSISSTNRDRNMQYFNDYYRTYDIINENCDKGPEAPVGCGKQQQPGRADVHMQDGSFRSVQHSKSNGNEVSGSDLPDTFRRPCFIVGGDGYEGDEDDESSAQKRNRAIANEAPALQQGDLLLQAMQRTAMLNGSSERDGQERYGRAKNVHGNVALNNNNYTTANNNFVERDRGKDGSAVPVANGGKQHEQHTEATRGDEMGERNGAKLAAANCETSECDTFSKEKKLDLGDCRLCKRQKTKHNFKLNLTPLLSSATEVPPSSSKKEASKKTTMIAASTVLDCGSTPPGCRRTLSESLVGHFTIPGSSAMASGSNGHGAANYEGPDSETVHSGRGMNEPYGLAYSNVENLSPGDSPMLSSSTGAVGNGIFTFEQMKSYRRAFSEDVIDTITSLGPRSYAGNDRTQTTEEDSTDDTDGSNGGDNEVEQETHLQQSGGCVDHRRTSSSESLRTAMGTSAKCGHQITRRHRPHTSTPAGNDTVCKEPLYISCSETDCSVSTASSVSPHKKQILSCAAIGSTSLTATSTSEGRTTARGEDFPNSLKQQLTQHKTSSKINLNYVFCLSPLARDDSGFTSGSSPATSTTFPATSPIAIDDAGSFGKATKSVRMTNSAHSAGLFRYDFEETPVSPVSGTIKSKSAPAFPFSPPLGGGALSPRFLRNAQRQFHHRTRYPSERSSFSERSSIGSDEQFSDDDLSSYLLDSSNGGSYCSPLSGHQLLPTEDGGVGSALKMSRYMARTTAGLLPTAQMLSKVLNRNLFRFGRAPMLGTLEESLLQRRLSPKFQVADFKVLLGASGSFCPTQLTIPAASYFYELPGQHLTTPYVCELRLPRKGYSIPRTGTVQATLLNPLGTVVRMFVVPYDFRDMPAMSTTFIRQRILACDDSSLKLLGKNIEQLSNAEQMKLLRYAIHLRFQTSRSGKLSLHTDIRLLISRRTDCDTAAAHAKNLLESPNELKVVTIVPDNPKFSLRIDKQQ